MNSLVITIHESGGLFLSAQRNRIDCGQYFQTNEEGGSQGCIRCFQQIRKTTGEKSIAIRNLSRWRQTRQKSS